MKKRLMISGATLALAIASVGPAVANHDGSGGQEPVGACPDGMELTHDTLFAVGPNGQEIKELLIDVDHNRDGHACYRPVIFKLIDPQLVDNSVPFRERIIKDPPNEK